MKRSALAALVGLVAGAFVPMARADTPPNVWDLAKDPAQRERWALHVRVDQLLHPPTSEDVVPSPAERSREELRLEAARAMLEEAHAAASPDVRLRFDLGVVYERLADAQGRGDLYERVIQTLAPALEAEPSHPASTLALEALVDAYTHLDRTREEVRAARIYIQRLTDDRSRVVPMMNMGEAEMRLGRLDDATDTFRNVLQMCGSLPNSSSRNSTYALTMWDLAVTLDRGGDASAAMDTAAKAMKLSWDEVGPMGLPREVSGWDAIRDQRNVYFVPDWEREWYLALGNAAAARDAHDDRESADLWAASEAHWATYVARAASSRQNRFLAIARLRHDRAHADRLNAEKRAPKPRPHEPHEAVHGVEHPL
jgi:tetratricopeptide (TPR) repeat protein